MGNEQISQDNAEVKILKAKLIIAEQTIQSMKDIMSQITYYPLNNLMDDVKVLAKDLPEGKGPHLDKIIVFLDNLKNTSYWRNFSPRIGAQFDAIEQSENFRKLID